MAALALHRLTAAALAGAAAAVQAHEADGAQAAGASAAGTLAWTLEPGVLALLALSGVAYAIGVARLWRHAGRGRGVDARAVASFAGGWLALVVALVSPLDALGAQLFAAHMVQHEVLMGVAAPLLVLGRPLAAWAWALPSAARRGAGRALHQPAWQAAWRAAASTLGATLVHAVTLWAWHVPAWFDAVQARAAVHAGQHASFLAGALLFWWAVLRPAPRAAQGRALAALFATLLHTGALGALLALAPTTWYTGYAATAPAWGLGALEDQQLGGLVMWFPGGLAYLAAALWLAWHWIGLSAPGPAVASRPPA